MLPATYPIFINCYQQMVPQPLPQYSPYQQQQQQQYHHDPSLFYQSQPVPIAFSPGRFDTGYDSDASGSFAAGASPTELPTATFPAASSPVIYYQSPVPQMSPPPAPCDAANESTIGVWRDKFVANFSRFPIGAWHLKIVSQPPDLDNSGFARHLWRYRLDKAKVTFVCTACQCKTAATATGQAVFWIYKDDTTNAGHIHMKLYGQACPQCRAPAEAIWRPRDAARALDGLFDQVAQQYYGVTAPSTAPGGQPRSGRRHLSQLQQQPQQTAATRLPC